MKTLKLNLIIALFLIASFSHAQTADWLWAKQGTGTGHNEGKAVVSDQSGNIYVVGQYSGTATFGTISLYGGNMFLAKYDDTGNVIWVRSVSGTITYATYDIDIDSDNNLYVTGTLSSSANFGGINLTTHGSNDVFIAKYNSSGNLIWAKNYGGSKYDDVKSVSVDGSHNIIITGSFYDNTDFGSGSYYSKGQSDIYVAKFDSSGTLSWFITNGGKGIDKGNGTALDKDGNIYIGGDFGDTCKFGNTTLIAQGMWDAFTVKFDANGNCIWAKQSVGTFDNVCNNICTDKFSNVYLTGSFGKTASFGTHSISAIGNTTDIYIVKYDSSGDCKWATKAGGSDYDHGFGLYVNSSSEVFVSGFYYHSATFGSHSISGKSHDIYVAKCSPAGSFEWVIGAGSFDYDECWSLTFSNNTLIAVGGFTHAVSFGTHQLTAPGTSMDMYIGAIGIPAPPSISITENPKSFNTCPGESVTFYVAAIGSGMSYQWKKNGNAIPGATDSFLVINGVSTSDAGSYTCTISDASYSVTSNPGVLSLGGEPVISQQPENKHVNKGQRVTIKVIATGATSYQWQKNGVDISGETTSTLIFNSIQVTDEGTYSCVLTGSCGSVLSNESTVFVSTAGINNPINDILTIAPNPSYGIITITPQSLDDEITVEIYDTKGQKAISKVVYGNNQGLDLSHLNKGVYIILANSKGNSFVGKIVLR